MQCRKDVSLARDNYARAVIRATDVLSVRDALVSVGAFPKWLSAGIVSDRTACDLLHAFSLWQSKCMNDACHETKSQGQETPAALFDECIPQSNMGYRQGRGRSASAAPVSGEQARYGFEHHPAPDSGHPGSFTSECAS